MEEEGEGGKGGGGRGRGEVHHLTLIWEHQVYMCGGFRC